MKKIVGIVAAASLVAGLAFADGPTANVSVTDFTGNAQVQWGVDLDAGQTGFKNSEYMKFVINLFDAGTKTTEANGDVWAELVMKAGNTKNWTHRLFNYDANTDFTADGATPNVGSAELSFDIDTAKIHFGDFYVGILNGDTTTGEYKFDGAIRGFDHWKGQGKWLEDVGPAGYKQGIVAGYGNNNLGVDVDFRSAQETTNQYTSNYAVAAELKLKDSNEWVEGLAVDLGGSMGLTKGNGYKSTEYKVGDTVIANEAVEDVKDATLIGYSANVGYKLKIDDKYWLKPAVAFTGTNNTVAPRNTSNTTVTMANRLVAGVMFGWGSAKDAEGGVYYFDNSNNSSRKVCPGVSVVAQIPLAGTRTTTAGTTTTYDLASAIIVPSFYTDGDLVEGLKAAAYAELALLNGTASTDANVTKPVAADKDDTFAMALAAAVAYDIKADDITVTPQAGFRFVNTAYADNNIGGSYKPLSNEAFFTNLGKQKKVAAGEKRAGLYENGFFNLKAGVNVNGLINNTDLFVVYESANLMNGIDYSIYKNADGTTKKFYNVKAGTLNVGCKISF
jgi:hypothetical protein